jgi:hypothetical protein
VSQRRSDASRHATLPNQGISAGIGNSRPTGVGAPRSFCSPTMISLGYSRLLGDNLPKTEAYPRCRER